MQIQMKINKESKHKHELDNIHENKKAKIKEKYLISKIEMMSPKLKNKSKEKEDKLVKDMDKMNIDSEHYTPEDFKNKNFYLERENKALIHNYGPDLYEFSKKLEERVCQDGFLQNHEIDSQIRTKMVDWMIEVLFAYNSDPQTLFMSVQLLDSYLSRTKEKLSNQDIHLTGIVCLFIASKMEDIIPLRMSHIRMKIGHGKFTEKDIKRKERKILEILEFDLIMTSTYDFIKTFIYDFCHNNKEYIDNLNMHHHIDAFDNICIFLSKMMFHHEDFSKFR
jgi:hypothetical protein